MIDYNHNLVNIFLDVIFFRGEEIGEKNEIFKTEVKRKKMNCNSSGQFGWNQKLVTNNIYLFMLIGCLNLFSSIYAQYEKK